MAERKSVSAEDTIRLSRVVCSVRCHPRKTSLCATLKQVKTFQQCALFGALGKATMYIHFFVGAACLHAYIAGDFALLL